MTTTNRPVRVDTAVLDVLAHPRYGGAFLPVWRILDAAVIPVKPAAVRRSLERLEADGRVERRRAGADQIEWRLVPAADGSGDPDPMDGPGAAGNPTVAEAPGGPPSP